MSLPWQEIRLICVGKSTASALFPPMFGCRAGDYDAHIPQEAKLYADNNGFLFMETSAKTGQNVSELFAAIGICTIADLPAY